LPITLAEALDGGKDDVSGPGPAEGPGICVADIDAGADVVLQLLGGAMGIVPDLLLGEQGEDARCGKSAPPPPSAKTSRITSHRPEAVQRRNRLRMESVAAFGGQVTPRPPFRAIRQMASSTRR